MWGQIKVEPLDAMDPSSNSAFGFMNDDRSDTEDTPKPSHPKKVHGFRSAIASLGHPKIHGFGNNTNHAHSVPARTRDRRESGPSAFDFMSPLETDEDAQSSNPKLPTDISARARRKQKGNT